MKGDYAISDEAGAKGERFVRVIELDTGLQFHFGFSAEKGLHFISAQSDPPRLDLPKEPPEQVLGQAAAYARAKGWWSGMRGDDFEVVEVCDTHIRVRHATQGHEYTFGRAWDDRGVRILSTGQAHINSAADYGHETYHAEAYAFAIKLARNAGVID